MSDINDVQNRVRELVNQQFQMALSSYSNEEDLHLDSMALLGLIVALEKEFGIRINEGDVDTMTDFKSITSISLFIAQYL